MWQALIGPIAGLLGEVVEDKDKKNELAHKIATAAGDQAFALAKAQLEVNKVEAAHKSLFVAGWRPFTGWSCSVALAFNYIVTPLGNMILAINGVDASLEPLQLDTMLPVLIGMLGLGTMRTFEKGKGVQRES